MRKFIISVLMAGVMMPAAALAQDNEGSDESREQRAERASSSDEGQAPRSAERADRVRVERAQSVAREPRFQWRERQVEQNQRVQQVQHEQRVPTDESTQVQARRSRGGFVEGIREVAREQQTANAEQVQQAQHNANVSGGGHGEYHRDVTRDHRDLHASDPSRREHRVFHRDQKRDHRTEHRSWDRNGQRAGHGDYHRDVNREHGELHAGDPTRGEHRNWHRDVSRQHDRRHSAWDTSWRSNRSYDWRGYRNRYSSIYNLSRYYDPYGWGYRRFSIGVSLGRGYYGSNYWLNDPWQYRLPPAYGPYRWVRYYDDALLVNIYSGEVVDVIHSFFW